MGAAEAFVLTAPQLEFPSGPPCILHRPTGWSSVYPTVTCPPNTSACLLRKQIRYGGINSVGRLLARILISKHGMMKALAWRWHGASKKRKRTGVMGNLDLNPLLCKPLRSLYHCSKFLPTTSQVTFFFFLSREFWTYSFQNWQHIKIPPVAFKKHCSVSSLPEILIQYFSAESSRKMKYIPLL